MQIPTPRQVIDAALRLGDVETDRRCPAGISSSSPEQLADLVAAADTLPRPDSGI